MGGRPVRRSRPRSSTAGPTPTSCATPFVTDPADRSPVVGTIDFDDAVDADDRRRRPAGQRHRSTPSPTASSAATSCGSPCSRPSSPTDVEALTTCIDHVLAAALSHEPLPCAERRGTRDVRGSSRRAAPWPVGPRSRAQLTGPGGDVRGHDRGGRRRRDEGLQGADGLACARSSRSPRRGATRTSSSTATAASRSPSSSRTANGISAALAALGVGHGDRVAVLSAEQSRVVPHVLGHRRPRRRPRRAQRLVEDRRDRLRPAGLGRQGAGGRSASASSASPSTSTSCPSSSTSSSLDATPTSRRRRATRLAPLRRADHRPHRCASSTRRSTKPTRP